MKWLRARLREIGKTGVAFGNALGIAKARVYEMYKNERQFQSDEIETAARFLGWTPEELLARIAGRDPEVNKSEVEGRQPVRRGGAQLPSLILWKSSATGGGLGGAFMLNSARAGEIERPDYLQFNENAFATKVVTADNEPVYRPRDTLLINPEEPPVEGDDCIFCDILDAAGSSPAIIGQLLRATPDLWIIRQYAEMAERELARKAWPNAWRIVGRQHRS